MVVSKASDLRRDLSTFHLDEILSIPLAELKRDRTRSRGTKAVLGARVHVCSIFQVLPTEIGYRTLKILIQYMYSGEATVTNDQLEGVLKAGDILRVRGLWRSNTGSKKENIQSNNQKVERDKKEQPPLTGQIQKIKLIQPTTERIVENVQQPATTQNIVQAQKPIERKNAEKIEEKSSESETKKILEENKNNEQNKNKENLETNRKSRKSVSSDVESNKSRSEGGENVRHFPTFTIFLIPPRYFLDVEETRETFPFFPT